MSPIGKIVRLSVHEKLVEEARFIETRDSGTMALVEWRGNFCEVMMRRIDLRPIRYIQHTQSEV